MLAIIFVLIFVGFLYYLISKDVKKRAGIYSQPTFLFPLKFALMKFVIARRQKKAKSEQAQSDGVTCLKNTIISQK